MLIDGALLSGTHVQFDFLVFGQQLIARSALRLCSDGACGADLRNDRAFGGLDRFLSFALLYERADIRFQSKRGLSHFAVHQNLIRRGTSAFEFDIRKDAALGARYFSS